MLWDTLGHIGSDTGEDWDILGTLGMLWETLGHTGSGTGGYWGKLEILQVILGDTGVINFGANWQ